MTRLLQCLQDAKLLLQEGLGSRRWAKESIGDNSLIKIEECKDLLDRIPKEDGSWARMDVA